MKILVFYLILQGFVEVVNSNTYRDKQTIDKRRNIAKSYKEKKPPLAFDEAWLTVQSYLMFPVRIYYLNHECYKCPMSYTATIPPKTTKTIKVNTTFGTTVEFRKLLMEAEVIFARVSMNFKERGDYWVFFDEEDYSNHYADIMLINDPYSAELPILYVFLGLVVLAVIINIFCCIYVKLAKTESANITDPEDKVNAHNSTPMQQMNGQDRLEKTLELASEEPPINQQPKKSSRLKSLDAFRGLSLIVMMFVNYGGGGYWFFDHPPWNGLTVADLVFPWFVFIMGTSINFAFKSMFRRGKSRIRILWKIVRRSCLIFAIGIVLNTNWGPIELKNLRIPGVLQRLALTYLVTSLVELVCYRDRDPYTRGFMGVFRDIVPYLHSWFVALAFLAAQICITYLLPVPGCPTGYVGPGGKSEGGAHYNCTGGAAAYIDRMVLGDNHIYGHPTPQKIYETITPHDPEGILGTLTSIFLCFLGLQAGRILMLYTDSKSVIFRWIIWGIVLGGLGTLLCKASQNEGWVPLNKNLWSVSFVLITGGMAFLLLTAMYVIIDVFHLWEGGPLIYPGMNSIVVYTCHDVFYRFFPVNWVINNPQHWELLLKATWDTAIWVVLAYILYIKKIFIAL